MAARMVIVDGRWRYPEDAVPEGIAADRVTVEDDAPEPARKAPTHKARAPKPAVTPSN